MSQAVSMNAVMSFKAQPGKADTVISIYNEMANKVKEMEPDCLSFCCIRLKDSDDFVCFEKYSDFQAQEDHLLGETYKAFKEKVSPFLEQPIATKVGHSVAGFESKSASASSSKGGIKYKILAVK